MDGHHFKMDMTVTKKSFVTSSASPKQTYK